MKQPSPCPMATKLALLAQTFHESGSENCLSMRVSEVHLADQSFLAFRLLNSHQDFCWISAQRPTAESQVPEDFPGAEQHHGNLLAPRVASGKLHCPLGEHVERVAGIALPKHYLAADVSPLYRGSTRLV